MAETVYLIDVFSLLFQVFHGIPPMTSATGQPTNAVFGFCRDMVTLLRDHRPGWIVCAMDTSGPGVRDEIYPAYKANRDEMPADLSSQLPLLCEALDAFGLPRIGYPGWEADDVIATLTRQAVAQQLEVRIVTSDKDARQLLGPQVRLYNFRKDQYLDTGGLLADWGIRPDQVVDFQSLVGDAVDNVPGVPLVGPKKAALLLQQFETLEAVLANTHQAPGAKLRENLTVFADQARLSRKLVELNQHLEISFDWSTSRTPRPNVPRLTELFRELGFRRLIDDVRQLDQAMSGEHAAPQRATGPLSAPVSGPVSSPTPTTTSRRAGATQVAGAPAVRGLFDDLVDEAVIEPLAQINQAARISQASPDIVAAVTTESADKTQPRHGESNEDTGEWSSTQEFVLPPEAAGIDERRWSVVSTPAQLDDFCARLSTVSRVCLDLETTSVNPTQCHIVGWAFCWQPGEAWYLPVMGPPGSELLDAELVVAKLKPLLERPDLLLVNQNIKYDLIVLRRVGIEPCHLGLDPMVGDYLLDSGARSHNLEALITKYFRRTAISISELIGTGKKQITMNEVPVAKVAEYATEDADLSLRLVDTIERELRAAGLWELYWELERPLIPVLAQMELTGIRVDAEELARQSAGVSERLTQLVTEIHTLAGHEFNIDSPLQLRKVLFEEHGLPVRKRTKTGPSTDQEVLEELAPLHPLPAKITDHRQLSKLKGTYLDALPSLIHPQTGRIHCSFNQVVAATGRLSSSDPNLQNIPIRTAEGRKIRKAFLPGISGWKLLCADYSQIELRVLAHFSQDPVLLDAFAQGVDIHTAVASDVFGVVKEQVDPEMRRVAKAVNFGVIYGQSAFGLAAALGIPKGEAARFIENYFRRYAGVTRFLEEILDDCAKSGYATTIRGRRRRIEGIRRDRSSQRSLPERTAINTVIQGSAADLIKLAMIRVQQLLHSSAFPANLLLQIHDELVLECQADRAAELVQLVRTEMEQALTLRVPLTVDVTLGDNWLDGDDA